MSRRRLMKSVLLAGAVLLGTIPCVPTATHAAEGESKGMIDGDAKNAALSQLSLQAVRFERNVGQTNSEVDFLVRGLNYNMYLTGPSVVIQKEAKPNGNKRKVNVLRMDWVGANQDVVGVADKEIGAKSNYLIGSDQSQWHTNLTTYRSVRYSEMYKGIDVVYYASKDGSFEYDAIVAPGADVANLRLKFEGADSVTVDGQGCLRIGIGDSSITKSAPIVYQLNQIGERELVDGKFSLDSNGTVGFEIGAYDHSRPLTIDPTLGYSTYLGGNASDTAWDVFVTSSTQVFVTGTTISPNFPTSVGAYDTSLGSNVNGYNTDAFVTKLNPTLSEGAGLVYSTFIGGNGGIRGGVQGLGNEDSYGIAVDSDGSAYITGSTSSFDYPTTDGSSLVCPPGGLTINAYMTKLNPSGNGIEYASIVGRGRQSSGTLIYNGYTIEYDILDSSQVGRGIVVDANEVAYIAGGTAGEGAYAMLYGANFPPDYFHLSDAFSARFPTDPVKSDGYRSVLWNICNSDLLANTNVDYAYGIGLDPERNIYITGVTYSTNFLSLGSGGPPAQPALSGNSDAFVLKMSNSMIPIYSTYLGGPGWDIAYGIAVDSTGSAYVTGGNGSGNNFPKTVGAYQTVKKKYPNSATSFVTKVNTTGTAWSYSTYLDIPNMGTMTYAIALDSSNNVYATGNITSFFPSNVMVAKLNSTGSALLGSFTWGASEYDSIGCGIAVDSAGNAYVAGYTDGFDFSTTEGAFDTTYNNGREGFFSRVDF